MGDAAPRPSFDPDGAPVSVLVDFDGTISSADVGDVLLRELVEDQALVRRMDQLYVEGLKGSRELIAWDMEVLPREPQVLLDALDALPLDTSFVDLVDTVVDRGGAVEIVSDGLGFHVQRMLDRLALPDIPIATNRSVLGAGAAGVTFPYGHPRCHVCGTCKRERIRTHQAARRATILVGDGPSDRYAAHHADIVFAKASLAAWCDSQDLGYVGWERLGDVARWIRSALDDGRLPADAATYGDWAAAARPHPETFICGPEVWGAGRTVADPLIDAGQPSGRS